MQQVQRLLCSLGARLPRPSPSVACLIRPPGQSINTIVTLRMHTKTLGTLKHSSNIKLCIVNHNLSMDLRNKTSWGRSAFDKGWWPPQHNLSVSTTPPSPSTCPSTTTSSSPSTSPSPSTAKRRCISIRTFHSCWGLRTLRLLMAGCPQRKHPMSRFFFATPADTP